MQSILKSSSSFGIKSVGNLEQIRFKAYFYPIVKKIVRPHLYYNLKERLQQIDPKVADPELYKRINIGNPPTKANARRDAFAKSKLLREIKNNIDLEKKSRNRQLVVDFDAVEEEWNQATRSLVVQNLADHFKIFEHLFGPYAFFEPYIHMKILFEFEDVVSPIYTGNLIKPAEVATKPEISFKSEDDQLWTLLLVNPDGNLYESDTDMIHWFVTNIPGGRVNDGEEIVSYLPPMPPKGTGFHRCIFLLYKQEKKLDLAKYSLSSSSLESRTFKNENFYRENEDDLTPAGLSWFQVDWDLSVNRAFHDMGLKAPTYLYDFPKRHVAPQKLFPVRKSFNRYLDLHRPEKELQERLLLKRLSMTNPIEGDTPPIPFPQAEISTLPQGSAIWQRKDIQKQWDGENFYRDLYRGDERPKINITKPTKAPRWTGD